MSTNKVIDYFGQPIFTQVLSLIDDHLISYACSQKQPDKKSKNSVSMTTLPLCLDAPLPIATHLVK